MCLARRGRLSSLSRGCSSASDSRCSGSGGGGHGCRSRSTRRSSSSGSLPHPGGLIVGGTFLAELVVLTVKAARSPLSTQPDQLPQVIALVALAIVIVIMSATSRSRARLGVQGPRRVDVRGPARPAPRLRRAPDLPGGWHAETAVESAYGQSFSGDFVVATRSADGRWFEVVLVDVSGKGCRPGRSLLLSGALGGLLGEQEPNRFLTAANNYLLRQNWDEGFDGGARVDRPRHRRLHDRQRRAPPPSSSTTVLDAGRCWARPPGPCSASSTTRRTSVRTDGWVAAMRWCSTPTAWSSPVPRPDGGGRSDAGGGGAPRARRVRWGAKRLCASARAGETDDRAVVMIWRD